MTTFIVSFLLSFLLMLNLHLTLILLTLIGIAFLLFLKKNELLEIYESTCDNFSLLQFSIGFLTPFIIIISLIQTQVYSPKDFPSIKCHNLIKEDGIVSLSDCSDKKTYINTQIIGE